MAHDMQEKLLDDEDRDDPQPASAMRQFQLNDFEANRRDFPNNKVRSSKYSVLPWKTDCKDWCKRFILWRNLWEQFHRIANVYFLVVSALQLIPGLSPTGPYSTLVPLLLVLFFSFLKDSYEDFVRHVRDNEVNHQRQRVFRTEPGGQTGWRDVSWADVCVGDFVEVQAENEFPADLLLLWCDTEDKSGQCHIETANLDGETNLKLRKAHTPPPSATAHLPPFNPKHPEGFDGKLACKPPDDDLYRFEGWLARREKDTQRVSRSPIDVNSILLRGARLGGSAKSVMGAVVYTGPDTKLMKNQKEPEHKSSLLERQVNRQTLYVGGGLVFLVVVSSIGIGYSTWKYSNNHWYLQMDHDPWLEAGLGLATFLILFNNLIPISLYVSMEMVKIVQASLISSDLEMCHNDVSAKANTSSLNEELGQVQYIFSDKTGTLTCNVMDFLKFSVGRTSYGTGTTEIGRAAADAEGRVLKDDRPENASKAVKGFCFWDERVSDVEGKGEHWRWMDQDNAKDMRHFLEILAICHTVVAQKYVEDGTEHIEYQASSPDEQCLVTGVKHLGIEFVNRTPTHVQIQYRGRGGVEQSWQLLQVLEFDSDRKRMSVIVRSPEGKLMLFCKGADTIIFERLRKNPSAAERELEQKSRDYLTQFAADGLRTLLVAEAELGEKEYEKWRVKHQKASEHIGDRERQVAEVADEIERDLVLVGTTAIEDKLQKGVPATIELLRTAGITIWVLTGDKLETAINIGFACSLLHNDMALFMFDGSVTHSNITQILQNYARDADSCKRDYGQEQAIVVEGGTLILILGGKGQDTEPRPENAEHFLEICQVCKAVICCRVTPGQKAQVVGLVKRHLAKVGGGGVTLAIGDGANDVSMIGEAHVGVGISGVEGLQAARAADYSISQFRFLQRLLLVHGRWSYRRTSKLLLYSFYKNMALYITQFWYCLFNLFSAQSLYETWTLTMYNIMFVSMPILVLAVFDRDVEPKRLCGWANFGRPTHDTAPGQPDRKDMKLSPWETSPGINQFPELYDDGRKSKMFNTRCFWQFVGTAVWHSIVCFFVPLLVLKEWTAEAEESGRAIGIPMQGLVGYTSAVIVMTLKCALETSSWTWYNVLVILGSLAVWFVWVLFYCSVGWEVAPKGSVYPARRSWYKIYEHFGKLPIWFVVPLVIVIALGRDFAYKSYRRAFNPTLAHKIQQWEHKREPPEFDRRMLKREAPQLFPRKMVKQFKKRHMPQDGTGGSDGQALQGRDSGAQARHQQEAGKAQLEHLATAGAGATAGEVWAQAWAQQNVLGLGGVPPLRGDGAAAGAAGAAAPAPALVQRSATAPAPAHRPPAHAAGGGAAAAAPHPAGPGAAAAMPTAAASPAGGIISKQRQTRIGAVVERDRPPPLRPHHPLLGSLATPQRGPHTHFAPGGEMPVAL